MFSTLRRFLLGFSRILIYSSCQPCSREAFMNSRTLVSIAILLALSWNAGRARAEDSIRLPAVAPADVGLDAAKLNQIDATVREGIEQGRLPGAVVLVVRQGKIAF